MGIINIVFACEFGDAGIRVNSTQPGAIDTEMARADAGLSGEEVAKGIPLGRVGEVAEVSGAAVFLAGDLASYLMGRRCSSTGAAKHRERAE